MMKLNLFKKVCLTVMGVGVVSSLVSVGTFATFTATTTNSGNSFTAGTLTIQNSVTGTTFGSTNPNYLATNAGDPTGATADCGTTNEIAAACRQVINYSRVTASGMEPGQFLQGTIKLTNSGNLPATIGMEIQNATSAAQAAGTCGAGVTCVDPAPSLIVDVEDTTNAQCLFGGAGYVSGTTVGATQAPTAVSGNVYEAVTGHCDNPADTTTNTNFLGIPGTAANPASPTKDQFTTFKTFNSAGGGGNKIIYVPGNSTGPNSLSNAGSTGNITSIKQWKGGGTEFHNIQVTIALPDNGTTTSTTLTAGDTVITSADNQYQGGSVSFDLVFYAFQ